MGRGIKHETGGLLDATRSVLLQSGLEGATVAAIARASGWPVGSIYHRFGSREELLAALWLRAAERSQAAFFAAMDRAPDPRRALLDAGLALFDFAAAHPEDARLLAAFRRRDLLREAKPGPGRAALAALNERLGETLPRLAFELYGTRDPAAVDRALLAAIDIPLGAMRRRLLEGEPLPAALRGDIETASAAVLDAERNWRT